MIKNKKRIYDSILGSQKVFFLIFIAVEIRKGIYLDHLPVKRLDSVLMNSKFSGNCIKNSLGFAWAPFIHRNGIRWPRF